MARSPRNTQKRNTRRMFRSKAIALCNKHGITNLQVLCEDCNIGKSNKDLTDWRERAG